MAITKQPWVLQPLTAPNFFDFRFWSPVFSWSSTGHLPVSLSSGTSLPLPPHLIQCKLMIYAVRLMVCDRLVLVIERLWVARTWNRLILIAYFRVELCPIWQWSHIWGVTMCTEYCTCISPTLYRLQRGHSYFGGWIVCNLLVYSLTS